MDTDFDSADFAAEQEGDLVLLEFLKAAENQDFAFVFG